MKIFNLVALFAVSALLAPQISRAETAAPTIKVTEAQGNLLDQMDPNDPNIESKLQEFDAEEELMTGMPSHIGNENNFSAIEGDCYKMSCEVYAHVQKSLQTLTLYVGGVEQGTWAVSTARAGYTTPNLDKHPDGRIYDAYSSTKFPGGDYNGLGNMPYAVFISGGIAIHGVPEGEWAELGHTASHGCVRTHPDHAVIFNRLVRQYGIQKVWVTIED